MNEKTDKNKDANTIRSARIHEYQKPLFLDNTPKPRICTGEQVLVKVAAGLCHSDLHLINGQWKDIIPIQLPITPGHEVAGWIEELGDFVPRGVLDIGDLVAVFGGWGCAKDKTQHT
jgi:propanol-preferring alcohol dehydrogenase